MRRVREASGRARGILGRGNGTGQSGGVTLSGSLEKTEPWGVASQSWCDGAQWVEEAGLQMTV